MHATWRTRGGTTGFAVRVSINTGRAAIGMVGGASRQALAFGDVTNVASRLRSAAEPGTILVGETTARRLAHRFAFEPLGEIEVRGRRRLWRSRVRWRRRLAPTAVGAANVGREHETTVLRGVLDDVVSGRGRIVVVSGAAGSASRSSSASFGHSPASR